MVLGVAYIIKHCVECSVRIYYMHNVVYRLSVISSNLSEVSMSHAAETTKVVVSSKKNKL